MKLPWLKRKLMARERKETTALERFGVRRTQASFTRSQKLSNQRLKKQSSRNSRSSSRNGKFAWVIPVKTCCPSIQNIFTKFLTCEKFKDCSIAKIWWLIIHFLMFHNEPRNPFKVMFFVHIEFDYLVVGRNQRKVRKTTI